MCTVPLPPGVYPIAFDKYINIALTGHEHELKFPTAFTVRLKVLNFMQVRRFATKAKRACRPTSHIAHCAFVALVVS